MPAVAYITVLVASSKQINGSKNNSISYFDGIYSHPTSPECSRATAYQCNDTLFDATRFISRTAPQYN